MAKGERRKDSAAGELLYTEAIPKRLRPRKLLAGKRWAIFESIGRILALALIIYVLYQLIFTDLSSTVALFRVAMEAVVAMLILYVTEIISPRGRRMSIPVRIYSKGLLTHTSGLETALGKPSFIPKEDISRIKVRRLTIDHEGKEVVMPTNLKLVLKNGRVLDLGRRNYNELYNMIKLLNERLGIKEE